MNKFIRQQSRKTTSLCVTVRKKIKLSFGHSPRTSICQNKWILFHGFTLINNKLKMQGSNGKKEHWQRTVKSLYRRDSYRNFITALENEINCFWKNKLCSRLSGSILKNKKQRPTELYSFSVYSFKHNEYFNNRPIRKKYTILRKGER